MEELIVIGLLAVVVLLAVGLLIFGSRKAGMNRKQQKMLVRILISSALLLVLQLVGKEAFAPLDQALPGLGYGLRLAVYLVDYLIIGYDILHQGRQGNPQPAGL